VRYGRNANGGLKPPRNEKALTGQWGKGLSPLKREMPLQGIRVYGTGYKFFEMNYMKEGRLGVNPNNLVISKLNFEITRLFTKFVFQKPSK